jgi:hypothetical protein
METPQLVDFTFLAGLVMGAVIGLIAKSRNRSGTTWWLLFSLIAMVGLFSSVYAANFARGSDPYLPMAIGLLCMVSGPVAIIYLFLTKKKCPNCGQPVSRQGFRDNLCPSCNEPVRKISE